MVNIVIIWPGFRIYLKASDADKILGKTIQFRDFMGIMKGVEIA